MQALSAGTIRGALGVLEVPPNTAAAALLPRWRERRNKPRAQEGHVPYCHLYTDNLASRALQQSLGLSFADKNVWWLEND